MWRAEKAGVFQAPQPLCEEDSLVADAAVLRLPAILSLPEVMLQIPVLGKTRQRSENKLPCWKTISTCASLKSCQFCQLMRRSCSNPVYIDHQYWRKGGRVGVKQWPLWENHSFPSFHPRFLRNVEGWKSWSFPGTSTFVWRRFLGCWCSCLTASRNPLETRNHVACSGSSKKETSIEQNLPCWRNPSTCASSMSCQSCQLMGRSCSNNPVHINHQFWRERTHAGVSQWPLWEDHSLQSSYFFKGSDQWRVSPSQCGELRKLEFGRHLRPCVRKLLGCLCCCLTASRNPVVTRIHVACSGSEQEWALSIEQILPCWKNKSTCASSMSCQSCQLMGLPCSNPVHIDHQYWRKGRHAGVSQ